MIRTTNFVLRCLILITVFSSEPFAAPQFFLPKTALVAKDIGIVVNDADPLSVAIGNYYLDARHIPKANLIHVRFAAGGSNLGKTEFARIRGEVERLMPQSVQALAITWAAPYRVDCMSITSAFAFGFDKAYCSATCGPTRASVYYNSDSTSPYAELKIRPTMALAGNNLEEVKALIDRGVASDGTHPAGTGYLLNTSDKNRNVRAAEFPSLVKAAGNLVELKMLNADAIANKDDVLFYFTGVTNVANLHTLKFVPGAIADHLTSTGGQLTDSEQMSSLRWLEAGATASYGSVVEPCSFPQKFPDPARLMYWYLSGSTAIEAYWKSVLWPGEGIFIGEPLANPYAGFTATFNDGEVILKTQALSPGTYGLLGANSIVGPYTPEPTTVQVHLGMNELRFKDLNKAIYRLVRIR